MNENYKIQADINKFLDDFLSKSENRRTSSKTRREEFSSQWYTLEEEYAYNF